MKENNCDWPNICGGQVSTVVSADFSTNTKGKLSQFFQAGVCAPHVGENLRHVFQVALSGALFD